MADDGAVFVESSRRQTKASLILSTMDADTFLHYARTSDEKIDTLDRAVVVSAGNSDGSSSMSMLLAASESLTKDTNGTFVERRYLTNNGNLNEFVPSRENACWWLQFDNERYNQLSAPTNSAAATSDKKKKLARLEKLYQNKVQAELNHKELKEEAIQFHNNNMTSGKWILKTTEEHVDRIWHLLATKVRDETLIPNESFCVKCSSKRLAYSNSHHYYTICLYVQSGWTRYETTMRVRNVLHELEIDRYCVQPLYWKPDLYTYLPFSGHTYQWIDGVDTNYWFDHWEGVERHFLR